MPTIEKGAQVQNVITTFDVSPGYCQDLLEELTKAYDEFISKQPGFISLALHVNDAQTRIANYSQWERREDFLAMLRTDEMRKRNKRFTELCLRFEPVMYDVVHSIG